MRTPDSSRDQRRKIRVALVYFPWKSKTIYKFLDQVVLILAPISDSILVIGGSTESLKISDVKNARLVETHVKMHDVVDIAPQWFSKWLWAMKAIASQIAAVIAIVKNARGIDVVLFYMSYPHDMLPLIAAKLLRKKSCIVVTRSTRLGTGPLSRLYNLQDKLLYAIADVIAPESEVLFSRVERTKYEKKLTVEGYRYVDTEEYRIKIAIEERSKAGFISRLEKQKGVLSFLEAAEALVRRGCTDVPFLVAGRGSLGTTVEAWVNGLKNGGVQAEYLSWIPEDQFCDTLNDLRVLVFPTSVYAEEGLPTIVIEAMACGTPVLTTPVAAIPTVIKDGVTGFFLQDTSPECVAEGIVRVLCYEDIKSVVQQARDVIERSFSFDDAVERWRQILYGASR
jgi:glycosyltransferase involved in cell wall biosynthesis